ncbi:hypothetical protein H1R20_g3196, partial [Candolleomyces eurysporus]
MAPRTASTSPSSTDSEDESKIPVIAKLIVYTSTTTTSKKSKARVTKTTKATKTKNFSFAFEATEENYLELLKLILVKHHIKSLPDLVAKKRYYPMKIQVPPATKSDAEDVVNLKEFNAIARKFDKKPPVKAITIYVDMKEVERGLKKNRLDKDDSESGSEDEPSNPANSSDEDEDLTGPERELAILRGKLREKYGNDRDNSLSYTDPTTGENIPLTVFMTKEWARALYDKVPGVSLSVPPNTPTFDLINRQPSIKKPRSSSASASLSLGNDGSAVQALGTIHSIFGVFNSLLNRENGHSQGGNTPATPAPAMNGNTPPTAGLDSPLANTPTKLGRFLEYAEQKGVSDVTEMEALFRARGFGPDVIEHLSKEDLAELGISRGDGIRLQKLAPKWWELEKMRPKKRKAAEAFSDDNNSPRRLRPDRPLSIRFEKRWINKETGELLEGSASYFGSGFRLGQAHEDVDYCWWYFSREVQASVPVPAGYLPVLDGDYAKEIQVGDEDSD